MRRPCPKCGTWRNVTPEGAGVLCAACRHAETEAPGVLIDGVWVTVGLVKRWVEGREFRLALAGRDLREWGHNTKRPRRCANTVAPGPRQPFEEADYA